VQNYITIRLQLLSILQQQPTNGILRTGLCLHATYCVIKNLFW